MFHFRSHGSRDIGHGAKPGLEGAHAVLRWLSRGHKVRPAMRLSQAARSRHIGLHARPELPAFASGVEAYVSGLWKSPRNCPVRTADQQADRYRMRGACIEERLIVGSVVSRLLPQTSVCEV